MIRAVCFDLDDTLYDYRGFMVECERYLCTIIAERLGIRLEQCLRCYRRAKANLYASRPADPAIFDWHERISSLIRCLGGSIDMQVSNQIFNLFWTRFISVIRPYEDAAPALETIRLSGRKTAVISNGTREQQSAKLRKLGLSHLFDAQVYSEDVGANKPDPAIFRQAASELNVSPRECVMVGDLCHIDVKGARRAGMLSCWLRRGAFASLLPRDRSEEPDLTIARLSQLEHALSAL